MFFTIIKIYLFARMKKKKKEAEFNILLPFSNMCKVKIIIHQILK